MTDIHQHAHLIASYRATCYEAQTPHGLLRIRIGEPCADLHLLLEEQGATEWAFISAYNPHSRPLKHTENQARHRQLLMELATRGLTFFEGEGIPDEPGWEPERSVLILGISTETARSLAQRFDQNAIVAGRLGRPATLVWCVSPRPVHTSGKE